MNAGEPLLDSVGAMAIRALGLIGPGEDAPLVLLGCLFGGLFTFKMARRLAENGRRDVCEVMLDTDFRHINNQVDLADFRARLIRFIGMYLGIQDEKIQLHHQVYKHDRTVAVAYAGVPSPARVTLVQAMAGADRADIDGELVRAASPAR